MTMLADLLAALAGVPALPGAACAGRSEMFDPPHCGEQPPSVEHRHRAALSICEQCPALTDCADWIDALPPSQRPLGVVAGRIINPPRNTRQEAS